MEEWGKPYWGGDVVYADVRDENPCLVSGIDAEERPFLTAMTDTDYEDQPDRYLIWSLRLTSARVAVLLGERLVGQEDRIVAAFRDGSIRPLPLVRRIDTSTAFSATTTSPLRPDSGVISSGAGSDPSRLPPSRRRTTTGGISSAAKQAPLTY